MMKIKKIFVLTFALWLFIATFTMAADVAIYQLDGNDNYLRSKGFTVTGWDPVNFSRSGGNSRLLWRNTAGGAAIYKFDANLNFIQSKSYSPISGWIPSQYDLLNTSNNPRLIWKNTSTGAVAIYKLDATDAFVQAKSFGPYTGWSAVNYAQVNDNTGRLLLRTTSGSATVYKLDGNDNYLGNKNFSVTGWTPIQYERLDATGNARLVWKSSSGQVAIFKLDANDTYIQSKSYGPITGWSVVNYSQEADGTGRLVWKNTSGQVAVYKLDANDNYLSSKSYTATGWNAVNYNRTQGVGLTSAKVSFKTILVKKAGSGTGTISSGARICGEECSELTVPYVAGGAADLQVTPSAGSVFAGWQAADGSALENIYYANAGDTVFAVFEQQ